MTPTQYREAHHLKGNQAREDKQMNFFRIPRAFYDDHADRDLPTPKAIWGLPMYPPKGGYVIAADDPALPELINDAKYYADANGPDMAPAGLKQAAKALLKALGE